MRVLWILLLLSVLAMGQTQPTSGSLYSASSPLAFSARDLRATRVGDIVTILVSDSASALASGGTNTSRDSSAANQITNLLGAVPATNPLGALLDLQNSQQIKGQGQTSRDLALTTTLSARVVAFTLNGTMIVEGVKQITVNSETQTIALRSVYRI